MQVALYLGLVALVVLFATLSTVYTLNRVFSVPRGVENESLDRMATINRILVSHFGTWWPYLFFGMGIGFALLAIFVYQRMCSQWVLQVDNQHVTRLTLGVAGIMILLTAGITLLFLRLYLNPSEELMLQADAGYIPAMQDLTALRAQRRRVAWIAAGIVAFMLVGTLLLGYLRKSPSLQT
jgi:hypothetical protein